MDALLTIKQPFASAIIAGVKDVENRTWSTNHRGRLWIHAAVRGYRTPIPRKELRELHVAGIDPDHLPHPRGVILGYVTLVDVIEPRCRKTDRPARSLTSPWARRGAFHWLLEDPEPLDAPIPWPGRQSLTLVDPRDFLQGRMLASLRKR